MEPVLEKILRLAPSGIVSQQCMQAAAAKFARMYDLALDKVDVEMEAYKIRVALSHLRVLRRRPKWTQACPSDSVGPISRLLESLTETPIISYQESNAHLPLAKSADVIDVSESVSCDEDDLFMFEDPELQAPAAVQSRLVYSLRYPSFHAKGPRGILMGAPCHICSENMFALFGWPLNMRNTECQNGRREHV